MESKIEQWSHKLNFLYDKLAHAISNDDIFWQTIEVIQSNPHLSLDSIFPGWLFENYSKGIVVDIRALVDGTKQTTSIRKVLEEFNTDISELPSRAVFVARYPKGLEKKGNEVYDKYVGPGESKITKKMILADIETINVTFSKVCDYTNEYVTHLIFKPTAEIPTFKEIRSSLLILLKILKKYFLLITGASIIGVVPAPQENWLKVFSIKWLEDPLNPPNYKKLIDFENE